MTSLPFQPIQPQEELDVKEHEMSIHAHFTPGPETYLICLERSLEHLDNCLAQRQFLNQAISDLDLREITKTLHAATYRLLLNEGRDSHARHLGRNRDLVKHSFLECDYEHLAKVSFRYARALGAIPNMSSDLTKLVAAKTLLHAECRHFIKTFNALVDSEDPTTHALYDQRMHTVGDIVSMIHSTSNMILVHDAAEDLQRLADTSLA